MTQVVKHPHEDDEIERLAQLRDVPHRHAEELDACSLDIRSKAGLPKVTFIGVNAKDTSGPATLHLQGVEAAIAADVEHALTGQVAWNCIAEASKLHLRVV